MCSFPLQNNGTISWQTVKDLYRQRTEMRGLYLTKLTLEHVELTTFSKMKVRLAAQVSSSDSEGINITNEQSSTE